VQLGSSSNILIRRFTNLPNIIVMGDFSLPSINWLDGCGQIISNPNYGVGLNDLFIDLINDIGFIQFVNTPTRNLILYFLRPLPLLTYLLHLECLTMRLLSFIIILALVPALRAGPSQQNNKLIML